MADTPTWVTTSYAMTRIGTPFEVEPGCAVSPFPDPVVYAHGPVEVRADCGAPVRHMLAQPCGADNLEIDRFAIGRIVSGVITRRPGDHPRRGNLRGQFVLSCAFQVARMPVPAGQTLGSSAGFRELKVRMGMRRRQSLGGHYLSFLAREHHDREYYFYRYRYDRREDYVERSTQGQRFDRLRAEEFPDDACPSCLDREPREPRKIAIGAGWEIPGGPPAHHSIAAYDSHPMLAVDCRRPPGWCRDFDLSGLLDWPAPDCSEPVTLWIGAWVTSDRCHPIDFPEGVPPFPFPGRDDPALTTYFLLEQSGVMGFWEVLAS